MSGAQSFASTTAHKVNVPAFAFHIDVLLLSLFALYVALTLPRALVRLFQPSELLNGFFLRSGAQRSSPERNNSTRSTRTLLRADTLGRSGTLTKPRGNTSAPPVDHSTSAGKATDTFPALITPARRHRGAQQSSAPTRHPSLAYALNFRVSPGFSLGKFLVLVTYGLIVLYACVFHSNPFTDFDRSGYIAVSQVPIVMALAGKSNWLSWVCGVGYEKFNYIHRFSGRIVVVAANVHTLGYLYRWSLNGTVQARLRTPMFVWGLVAICALDLLFACSLSFVRDRMYSFFFATHVTCVVVSLLAIYMHYPPILPYLLAAAVLYAFDHIARIARTRYTTAWLTAENALNGGTTLVDIPSLGAGWRAGQHVRIRVVSDTWFGWWGTWLIGRARPFTIATGSNSGGMMLEIKAQGAWTRKLLRMADGASDARPAEKSTDAERGRGPAREVRIIVEGPYSGPGYTLYTAYSGVILVAGGSGISYATSVLDDILQKHASGKSNVRVIEVVWSVADPDSLYSLLPELAPLMYPRPSPHTTLSLRFSVHWTRTSSRAPRVPRTALPPGMHLRVGRPDVHSTLQSVIAGVRDAYSTTTGRSRGQSRSSVSPSGIVIGSCGPTALIDDATRAVGRVSWADWKDVGGVESIEEVFGW
ncbi:ferric reductase like transmembrane component-domain-containing protein [Lactarius psammicola]|nr:ferric reductase like transmembrane component-domain-containing protein [Lactarius psammicola]